MSRDALQSGEFLRGDGAIWLMGACGYGGLARLQAARWTRPLDPVVMGALKNPWNARLGIVTPETYYSLTLDLSRGSDWFFSQSKPHAE